MQSCRHWRQKKQQIKIPCYCLEIKSPSELISPTDLTTLFFSLSKATINRTKLSSFVLATYINVSFSKTSRKIFFQTV